VLDRLEGQAETRSLEEPRRKGIETLLALVTRRRRKVAEAKARRRDGHMCAVLGERSGELVVVPGREGWWIGEYDAHWQ